MTWLQLLTWLPTAVSILVLISLFVGRIWLQNRIERSVSHGFEKKLEEVRSEFRRSEETLKSELRLRESEILALRDGVLTARAQRQALLDKRRLDAVERVWSALADMAPYRAIANMMEHINLETAARETSTNPGIRQLVGTLIEPFRVPTENIARNERPFVSPAVWAYFQAYQSVLFTIYAQAKILELGTDRANALVRLGSLRDMLKKALPHHAASIDTCGLFWFSMFLDELEDCVLREITHMLEGHDLDQAGFARAVDIIRAAKTVTDELSK